MKFNTAKYRALLSKSHPVRCAWIEIYTLTAADEEPIVAPRKGCVD